MFGLNPWGLTDEPAEALPPRQDIPTQHAFLKQRIRNKRSEASAAESFANAVGQDLLAFVFRSLSFTVWGRERIFLPLPVEQWALAMARSSQRREDSLPLAPTLNTLLDDMDTWYRSGSYRDDVPDWEHLTNRTGAAMIDATGGLVLPRAVLDGKLDPFFLKDGRCPPTRMLELPHSSYPFVAESVHPETGAKGWVVAHTRCVKKGRPDWDWRSFVWFRKDREQALTLAGEILAVAEEADGGPYEVPEPWRARVPAFLDPLRLVLPFPDLRYTTPSST